MGKPIVWVSGAMINPAMLRPITHSFFGEDQIDFAIAAKRANEAGKPLGSEHFPPEIFVKRDAGTNYDKLPDLFFAGSYWVVSGAVAEVMRRFDLGEGALYPTKVYRKDRKTPIGDEWFCLNFGNVKSALDLVRSTFIRQLAPGTTSTFHKLNEAKNGQLVLDQSALDGPELWVDENLGDAFFLSEGLGSALKNAGLSRPFGLKKCKLV